MEAAIQDVTGGAGIQTLIKKAVLYTVSVVYFPELRSWLTDISERFVKENAIK